MLHGRWSERARLDELVAGARRSRSGALMVHGEPGVGKSTLLAWAAERATPTRCLRASGVESELELPFAVLDQLVRPVLDRLDDLPAVQAHALRGALGLGPGRQQDPFLVAVAVLTCSTMPPRPAGCCASSMSCSGRTPHRWMSCCSSPGGSGPRASPWSSRPATRWRGGWPRPGCPSSR